MYNLIYDGPNFCKYKGFLDPLEDKKITERRNEILKLIDNNASTEGIFQKLLYTHNMPFASFESMLTGLEQYLRDTPNGVMFRHGIDSQYGDIILVMKPNSIFQNDFSSNSTDVKIKIVKGVQPVLFTLGWPIIQDKPFFYKPFLDITTKNVGSINIDNIHKQEANQHTFRKYDSEDIGKYGDCYQSIDFSKKLLSWCNLQIHIKEHISLRHVDFILVPSYLKDNKTIQKFNTNLFIDNVINFVYNKIIFIDSDKNITTNNYSYHHIDKQETIQEAIDNGLRRELGKPIRNLVPRGNSSRMSLSREYFKNVEIMYMKLLLYYNYFLPVTQKHEMILEKIKETYDDPLYDDLQINMLYGGYKQNKYKYMQL